MDFSEGNNARSASFQVQCYGKGISDMTMIASILLLLYLIYD